MAETVARIVDGLTKISHLSTDKDISLQAENFRKMLLTLNEDIRVIIIKIADRLHNMQTMGSMPPDKQVKIASETLVHICSIGSSGLECTTLKQNWKI